MRHWNRFAYIPFGSTNALIFTLPMRHWNNPSLSFLPFLHPLIFTLPMRHWNRSQAVMPETVYRFLPYLWGIETRMIRRTKKSKSTIFTLPMRHWNEWSTFFLPISNTHFYPTYEALKLRNSKSRFSHRFRKFLPYLWGIETRKDWRPRFARLSDFYPTYEALKQMMKRRKRRMKIRFLPYLWGIETYWGSIICKRGCRFLPYLWGIETPHLLSLPPVFSGNFYPTYEALKLMILPFVRPSDTNFYPTYEALKLCFWAFLE